MSILGGDRKKPDAIQPFFVSFLECLMTRKGEEGEIDEVQDTVCICFTFSLPDRPLYTFSIKETSAQCGGNTTERCCSS